MSRARSDEHAGEACAAQAMLFAERGSQSWADAVREAIERWLARVPDGALISSDDVWEILPDELANDQTIEPRALGNIMRRLAAEGLIVKTPLTRRTNRIIAHRAYITVWSVRIPLRCCPTCGGDLK